MRTAPLWKLAEVNPPTPEFADLAEGEQVSFLPLEAIWPGDRADYSRTLPWSSKLSYTMFRCGDVLVPKITPTFEAGRSIVADTPTALGLATTEVHVLRPRSGADARLVCYMAQSTPFLKEGETALQGVGNLRRVSPMFMQTRPVLDVDLPTQRRIADYLDRETGEIDAMLAKLDALAEVLEGRKVRSVAGAVRLAEGEVPDGWYATRLKYVVAQRFTGEWGSEPGRDELDVPVLRVADFNRKARTAGADVPTVRSLPRLRAEAKMLRPGDLLLERSGGTAVNPVGNVMLYNGEGGAVSSNFIECIRLADSQEPRFWCYVQWASYATGFTNRHVRQTTGIQNLDAQMFYDEEFVVPPLPEQERIADHLDEVTGRIDAMLAKVAQLKDLLIERRAALITAVVTGRKEVA